MNQFITNLSSLYWWVSVVIVGILINILSAYLKDKLDSRLSNISSWWRTRSEEQRVKRLKELTILRADIHEQTLLAISEVRERVRAVMLTMFGIVIFIVGIALNILPPSLLDRQSVFARILNIVIPFLGSLSFTSGIISIHMADDKNKLLKEALSAEKHKDGVEPEG